MAKKTVKHVYRTGRLSAEEAARNRELRRKIQEEFPPLEPKPDVPILSEPLREAIAHCGKSIRRLAKDAKVSEIVLQQFLNGERDLRLATAERLALILKLKLVAY
jgi:ribosome-binding protein aMBF1 (putative translation factor)